MRIVSILEMIEKSKENRSLHDLHSLGPAVDNVIAVPSLISPGPHILEFMSRQNVKEKRRTISKCARTGHRHMGMKYESLRNDDFQNMHTSANGMKYERRTNL